MIAASRFGDCKNHPCIASDGSGGLLAKHVIGAHPPIPWSGRNDGWPEFLFIAQLKNLGSVERQLATFIDILRFIRIVFVWQLTGLLEHIHMMISDFLPKRLLDRIGAYS
jgi:hypothetical protein